jgi:hypothetical protein
MIKTRHRKQYISIKPQKVGVEFQQKCDTQK